MKSKALARITLAACFAVLMGCLLAGCASNNEADSEQQANRAYMSQVNGIMDELNADLEPFVDAVARGDVVNMRTQADNAYKVIDKLSALEAPEDLADIQKSYVDGANKLRSALDEYVDLYAQSSVDTVDPADFNKRIEEIQLLYDEGIEALKAGDEAAAALE